MSPSNSIPPPSNSSAIVAIVSTSYSKCHYIHKTTGIERGCNILGVFHPVKYWRSSAGSNPKHHLEVGVEQPKAKKRALQDVTNCSERHVQMDVGNRDELDRENDHQRVKTRGRN
ncbi:hypothetical protein OUZ56_003292 [Daphnia magna]|uniref:Uncharacterized protein n=1 Tax=Daphnia magna TaxID=35525 RepID=A0ABR0A8B1_9CRUS|nr:hypothetical protein OUZ56_003292 [Daphnia magna]